MHGLMASRWLCVCLACGIVLALVAPARSLQDVTIRDRTGQQVGLYTASYALVIGASAYAHWPLLPGVQQDVREVTAVLQAQGFQVELVSDPTRDAWQSAFESFIARYGQQENNRLLIYFAGHGHTMKLAYGAEMGYIVPVDAPHPQRDSAGFLAKALDMHLIENYARRIQAKHVLFLFDSCFSGTVFSLSRAIPEYIQYKTSEPVRQFITSGSANEQVPDISIFWQQLVAGLQGEADTDRDGYVTGAELGEFLQKRVVNYSNNTQHPQYGKLRDPYLDKGDFVFLVSASPQPPLPGPQVAVYAPAPETYRNSLGMEFVLIPAGTFQMGSDDSDAYDNEKPGHTVRITQPFYLGKYEVTQGQWQAVMGSNPSHFTGDPSRPVENVSWNNVQEFIRRLNGQEGGATYRLPTEAEWEYAARAGTTSRWSFGNEVSQLGRYAWYDENAEGQTHPVGRLQPNPWGAL